MLTQEARRILNDFGGRETLGAVSLMINRGPSDKQRLYEMFAHNEGIRNERAWLGNRADKCVIFPFVQCENGNKFGDESAA